MMLKAYTVYDNKALNYSPPFFVNTDGAAIRMFGELANDMSTQVGRHPSDYSLFCIGSFSDQDASLERELPVRHIIDATAMLAIKPKGDLFSRSMGMQERTADEMAHDERIANGSAK